LPRIQIVHVGSVTNKGTLALLKAEVSELKRIYQNPEISVSTCDIEMLRSAMPELASVPLLIDIPHEKADLDARKKGIDRNSHEYLVRLLAYSILMIPEIILSIVASYLFKLGVKRFYKSDVIASIAASDLVISTADENFKEGASNLPFNVYWRFVSWSVLLSRTLEIVITKHIFKKTVIIFPNSVGPFRTLLGRFLAKTAIKNVDLLFLRETHSLVWTENLEMRTPIIVTSDIVLVSNLDKFNKCTRDHAERPLIAVCPGIYAATLSGRKQLDYVGAHSKTLDRFVEKYYAKVVFLPHETTGRSGDDYAFCELILNRMKKSNGATILKAKTLEEFSARISQADLMLTSRMHPAVIACLCKVPTIVIYYDFKQLGLFEQLDLSSYVVDINQVSHENLMTTMEEAWKNKFLIRKHLELCVPILQRDMRSKIEASCKKFLDVERLASSQMKLKG